MVFISGGYNLVPNLMKTRFLFKFTKSSFVWQAVCLFAAVLVFSLILLNRSPNLLRPISISLRTGFGLVIPAAALLVYTAFRLPSRIGELLAMVVTMALFAFPLAGLWASGQTQSTVLSGLIPLYDAGAYYNDSLKLLAGQDFSIISARRPLFPALMSVLLAVTGRNLMMTLAALTAITGLACYLAVREIQKTHGPEAAVFVLMILFLFYRAHAGITMTENLGVAFGALGFGLLWRGTAERRQFIFCLGLLITTLALNARAGAFFMLPLLIVWAGWLFREQGRRFSWKVLGLSFIAVAAGFAINLLMVRWLAVSGGVPFANFSYTLYGLASGGKSWTYVYEAHPELRFVQGSDEARRIYQLAFELIREKPWQLVEGSFYNWKMLFSNTWYNIYAYAGGENWSVNVAARWILYFLCILGIIKILRKPADALNSLVLVSVVGIFISVPFLPPTDAYRMRPYAASIIVFGILPALGLVFPAEKWKTRIFVNLPVEMPPSSLIAWFSVALTLLILTGPPIIKAFGASPQVSPPACAPGTSTLLLRFDPGTWVNIVRQNSEILDWMPNFHRSSFRENAHALPDVHLINWTETVEQSNSFFVAMDYLSYKPAIVVTDTEFLPAPGSLVQVCGTWETRPELASFGIFYATKLNQVNP